MIDVKRIKMNNGHTIPVIGLGTWQAKKGEAVEAIKFAIDIGYRHIDSAMVYQNEADVGTAVREKIEDGTVKREDMFIVTKLWNTFHRPDLVVPACKRSLKNLGLEYIDLYLIHWPCAYKARDDFLSALTDESNCNWNTFEHKEYFPRGDDGKVLYLENDLLDTWREMEKCVDLKLNSRIKPVVNQVECHPYLNQKKLRSFCGERGILLTGYSPLGSPSRPWAKPSDPSVLDNPEIKEIASRIHKSPGQVVLNYLVNLGVIPIPKSSNKERLRENLNIFDFDLSEQDKKTLDGLNCNMRYCPLSEFRARIAPHMDELHITCPRVDKPGNFYICGSNGTTKNIVYQQVL